MEEKRDAATIRKYIAARDASLSVTPRWWPKYAYHFTDIRNAARVLEHGSIYSRRLAISQDLMLVENADTVVIKRSPQLTEESVRFYFRPRTPTQYRNEGIRPPAERKSNSAHCPVPVFFLFPLAPVLAQRGTKFTNTAAYWDEVRIGETAEDLKKLRWPDIYSAGVMPRERINELTGYRRAEILVPESQALDSLHAVICRTPAERATLLHLLPKPARLRWRAKIFPAGAQLQWLFEASWVYVETVQLTDDGLVAKFNPRSVRLPTRFEVIDLESNTVCYEWKGDRTFDSNNNIATLRFPRSVKRVRASIYLDECLAFRGSLNRLELLTS